MAALLGALVFGALQLFEDPPFFEGNPLESHVWESSASGALPDLDMQRYHDDGYTAVCIIPDSDTPAVFAAKYDGVAIERIVMGKEVAGYLQPLFHVLWVNASGDAMLWNFDWRRYELAFGPNSLKAGSSAEFGCRTDYRARISFRRDGDMTKVTFNRNEAE